MQTDSDFSLIFPSPASCSHCDWPREAQVLCMSAIAPSCSPVTLETAVSHWGQEPLTVLLASLPQAGFQHSHSLWIVVLLSSCLICAVGLATWDHFYAFEWNVSFPMKVLLAQQIGAIGLFLSLHRCCFMEPFYCGGCRCFPSKVVVVGTQHSTQCCKLNSNTGPIYVKLMHILIRDFIL